MSRLKHDPEKLQTFRTRSCDRTNTWSEIAIQSEAISLSWPFPDFTWKLFDYISTTLLTTYRSCGTRFASSLRRGVSGDDPEGGAGSGVPRLRRETATPGGPGSRPPGFRAWHGQSRWRLRCPTAGDGSMGPRPKIAAVERREGSRSQRDAVVAPRTRDRKKECACRRSARPSFGGRTGRCRHG
jgi:hypothetical protein